MTPWEKSRLMLEKARLWMLRGTPSLLIVSILFIKTKPTRSNLHVVGDTFITKDQLKIIDMPDTSLKVNHPKTGEEGYRVGLEVFHQLHCINLLRQVTYRDWYEDISGEFTKGAEDLKMHTGMHLYI